MGLGSPLLRRGAEMLQQQASDDYKVPRPMAIAFTLTVLLYFIAMFKVSD